MSVPISEQWFSTSIRRNRKSFIWAYAALVVILVVVVVGLRHAAIPPRLATLIYFAFWIPGTLCGWLLIAQRLRDIGFSGWLVLLWIPATLLDSHVSGAATLTLSILVAVFPGTKGPNRYGEDPLMT